MANPAVSGVNKDQTNSVDEQYAEGFAAKLWNKHTLTQSDVQKQFLLTTLRSHNVHTVLDSACGTGIDSVLLVEEGFNVVSSDFSDKMLAYPLEERWNRRKEPNFDRWVIKQADWFTFSEDLDGVDGVPKQGFDAVICIGNSIAHVAEPDCGQTNTKQALRNIGSFVKPGGIFVVDHRNTEEIIKTGKLSASISHPYRKEFNVTLTPNVVYTDDGKPKQLVIHYFVDVEKLGQDERKALRLRNRDKNFQFNISYTPHKFEDFREMLSDVFGPDAVIESYGDFKPFGEVAVPSYYHHIVRIPS